MLHSPTTSNAGSVGTKDQRQHHQGREFIANGALENGAFCTVFSENFHKF
jgi:hypothetical protein